MEDVTPLYLSIRQANVSMVQTLLRYSRRDRSTPTPDANPRINNEPPPLCLATSQGSEDIMRLLLDHDWDVNEVNEEGRTPLHLAAENGDRSVVQVLIPIPFTLLHLVL
jgi:ankyrin repeat protein